MLKKLLVTFLLSVLLFVSGDYDDEASCFPESLCNTTFSDPSSLKTMSSNIVHIGVSLRIIDNNNVRENATKPEFNEGFKVRQISFQFPSTMYVFDVFGLSEFLTDSKIARICHCHVLKGSMTRHIVDLFAVFFAL